MVAENAVARRFERIVPIPAVHLIVNLGEPYRVVARGRAPVDTVITGAFVSGVQLDYLLNENPPLIHHVGAELAPWALPAFGIDPVRVAERVVEAEELFPGVGEVTDLDGVEGYLSRDSHRAGGWTTASWMPSARCSSTRSVR